jgi:hypothetical protein
MDLDEIAKKMNREELVKFIQAQPDDRAVNMIENWVCQDIKDQHPGYCGCILVHFGLHLGLKEFSCGFDNYHVSEDETFRLEGNVSNFIVKCFPVSNYRDVKKHLQLITNE